MLELLESHLKAGASPETLSAITQACELFETYELPGYQEAYTDLLMSADNGDALMISTEIVTLTQDLQTRILQQMSIRTTDELSIQKGNVLLSALNDIEYSDFCEEIVVLCNGGYDSETALCEILAMVSGETAEYFYPLLDSVDASLITTIKKLCDKPSTASTQEVNRAQIDRLLRLKNHQDKTNLLIYDMLIDGEALNLPLQQYFDLMKPRLLEMKPLGIATQLFAASIVSCDASNNPRPVISEVVSKTYSHADEITPIVTAVESLMLQFHAQETSGVKVME